MENVVLNGCTCYNGDSLELMATMPDKCVDFILSDIPYDLDLNGGRAHGDFCTRKQIQSRKNSSLYFVSQGIDYDKVFSEFERICKVVNICVFCSNKQIGRIMTWWEQRGYVATLLVWDKPNPMPLGNGCYINNLEFIVYVRSKGATYNSLGYDMQFKTFRNQPPQAKERIHETEKPVSHCNACCCSTPTRVMWCLTLTPALSPQPLPATRKNANSLVARYYQNTTSRP